MKPIIVNKAIPFDSIMAGDIAITAAEGGIGYWSVIDSYKPSRWINPAGSAWVPDDFVFYTLDWDDRALLEGKIEVTPTLIWLGVQRFLIGTPDFPGREFDDMDDLSCMDAAEADCVIQLGAFGELVFG